jgi:3-phosphoshikimate 1-carboxyvinyltransferase
LNQISVKEKGPLRGELFPPPDKSISHRAVILAAISEGKSVIRNFLQAEDPLRTLEAFRQMGVDMESDYPEMPPESPGRVTDREIFIRGKGFSGLREPLEKIDCGNSGTTMRLLSGVLAGQPFHAVLTGDKFLKSRPMQRIITPLTEMGAVISSEKDGYPPLEIRGGKLKPINYISPVASAQVKSAILLAGLYCDSVTTVTEPGRSRDHTERMLKAVGADISINGLEVAIKGTSALKPLDLTIPGDFSSAAFFIAAGTIVPDSEILIRDTGINPTRTGMVDILRMMGAELELQNIREVSGEPVADIYVKHSQLSGVEIDGELLLRAIDEFPVLCVAASKAHGTTKITGAGELRVKESDRIASMARELQKMGVKIEEFRDGLLIEGRERLNSATLQSYGDHRIAMALLIAGLTAGGTTTVEDTDCIDTSFPGFMDRLEIL